MTKQKFDVYQTITDQLIEALEAGVNPWRKPWKFDGDTAATLGMPHNATNGHPYRGINALVLMVETMRHGYQSTGWITPKRAIEAGLNIKGAKTTMVVFWKKSRFTEKDSATGEESTREVMWAKHYRVLNLDQCEGDKSKLKGNGALADMSQTSGSELAEQLDAALSLRGGVKHQGSRAFYAPSEDAIVVPPVDLFESDHGYAGTILHEAVHSTGAKHRLDRDLKGRFGSESYAAEELVAELGATYLQAMLGIEGDLEHHASYLDSWLKVLKSDKKAIFTAASKAQAASDYVLAALSETQRENCDVAFATAA
jgi:antirestriction protein ArdC